MDPAAWLEQMRAKGFALRLDGEKVLIQPASKVSPEDRAWVQANRPALMAHLAREPVDAAILASLDRHEADPEGPAVERLDLAVVFMEGTDPVAVPVSEWETLRPFVAGWNEEHRPKTAEEAEQVRAEKRARKGKGKKR